MPLDTLPGGAVRLTDWGVIRAQGPDATSFLHGQLTQDILHLPQGRAALAGYCSAKGRLLASFIVCPNGAEQTLLLCSANLLAPTLKRLSMFVLRAKCRLSDASAELSVHGLVGREALADSAGDGAWTRRSSSADALTLRLPDVDGQPRGLRIQPAAVDAPELPAIAHDLWSWLEVRSAIPRVTAATVEQFVPQMVNLELVGGVNFQKGCYPGQEVVARSQYRGTIKRRSALFDGPHAMQPGQEVFDAAEPEQPAGMVVLAAASPSGGFTALVEVKIAAMGGANLRLGSPSGPELHPIDMPYALPAEAP